MLHTAGHDSGHPIVPFLQKQVSGHQTLIPLNGFAKPVPSHKFTAAVGMARSKSGTTAHPETEKRLTILSTSNFTLPRSLRKFAYFVACPAKFNHAGHEGDVEFTSTHSPRSTKSGNSWQDSGHPRVVDANGLGEVAEWQPHVFEQYCRIRMPFSLGSTQKSSAMAQDWKSGSPSVSVSSTRPPACSVPHLRPLVRARQNRNNGG